MAKLSYAESLILVFVAVIVALYLYPRIKGVIRA